MGWRQKGYAGCNTFGHLGRNGGMRQTDSGQTSGACVVGVDVNGVVQKIGRTYLRFQPDLYPSQIWDVLKDGVGTGELCVVSVSANR